MRFQGVGLCLGLLFITVNADFMDDGVEVEDFSENSDESNIKDEPSSGTFKYKTPQPIGEVYFTETFDSGNLAGWVLSKAKKDDVDSEIAIYDGRWEIEELKENQVPGDRGLVLKSKAKHHAIAAVLEKPFIFADKPLIVQYEVNFQDGIDCGGAYIKLLADTGDLILENFYDKTSYTIMFGPDKCGEDYKLHLIFRHKHPKTGVFEEKHAKPPDVDLKEFFTDRKTHLYTLVMNPDDTFEILIDQKVVNQGTLLDDVVPPINPPREIDDPSDKKPEEWDDRAKIPDPTAVKPEDWCRLGIWSPQKIPNPDYFEDDHPFLLTSFSALGLELWSMTPDIYFDNFIICSEKEVANQWATDGWELKIMVANANEPGVLRQLVTAAEERPWLWLMYLVIAGLPIALVTSFWWPRKAKKKYEDTGPKKTELCKLQSKAALEQEAEEEKAPEKPEDVQEEKKPSEAEVVIVAKEVIGEPEEKNEEDRETIEGPEEVSKLSKSGSEDEMKDADESTGSGDAPLKSLRKRRVRKD
ncbi:calmegin [Mus caroli]|uniref:Calmegin n=1 Tax=Mus caroli TaxID=10089 RepID=A0A6P5QBQ1_MUSCR|nr:calmegin [Mus caroli]